MKKKVGFCNAIIILIISATQTLSAQSTWTKTFGGTGYDEGNSVRQTSDSGFIIAGNTNSFGTGQRDIYLIKTNSTGDTLWTNFFHAAVAAISNSIQQTQDGGYIIAGTNYSPSTQENACFIKTDSAGDTLWTRTFGGPRLDWGISAQQTKDGGYIFLEETYTDTAIWFYLIKTDPSGDAIDTLLNECRKEAYSVQQTQDSGYIITGCLRYFQMYLIKTTSSGNILWTKTFGGDSSYSYLGNSVQQTEDGGFIIAGIKQSSENYCDGYLLKTNPTGDSLWTKIFDRDTSDHINSVRQTKDGGYIISGYTASPGIGNYDVYLIKTNSNGDTVWTKTFGGPADDKSYSVELTNDSGFIVVGYTKSFGAGGTDVYLIKTNGNGDVAIEEPSSNWSEATSCLGGPNLTVSQNPFSKSTVISYSLPANVGSVSGGFSLAIYNIAGKLVKSFPITQLPNSQMTTVAWDGTDNNANNLKTGIYFVRLVTGNFKETKKLILMK
ncbi:MAG: T9SS type A sorting domain-containing protein [bacterium]|nr:T9SS type A sorting domain-containing protein [bacterium]